MPVFGVPQFLAYGAVLLRGVVYPGQHRLPDTFTFGSLALGGSIEILPNILRIAELAVEKQAATLLLPVAARLQLNDLPDELWTKISIGFDRDAADAAFKALEN